MPVGRFAPSPTGTLHLGNFRTALLAWLMVRSTGDRFLLRVEDLEQRPDTEMHLAGQLADLERFGLDWDGPVIRQSSRFDRYHDAIDQLVSAGRTYECYCSRREIREAAAAPHEHLPEGAYPGTCRELTSAARRQYEDEGRASALRLRADGLERGFDDRWAGSVVGRIDDFVIRRKDKTPAYNLAVVIDDSAQGVEEVVRGDDLLPTTPRQILLIEELTLRPPMWSHVPLVVGPDGERLAKSHGSVTLADRFESGESVAATVGLLAASLGQGSPGQTLMPADLVDTFDPSLVPREPFVLHDL